ncbi:hypothetical protein ES703_64708 [subsurface metagenome]
MAVLNRSHFQSLYIARQILKNIDNANPHSRHHAQRKMQLHKLKEIQDIILTIVDEPMFDQLQNLDTGGPPTVRTRLETHLYNIGMSMLDGNQTT